MHLATSTTGRYLAVNKLLNVCVSFFFFWTDGFLDSCSRLSPSFGPYHFYLSVKISRLTLIIQRQRTLIHSMKSQSFLFLFHNNGFGPINGFLVYGLYLSQYNAVNMYWGDEANVATLLRSLV